ncbi:MAG: MGMT family protein [Bacteroidia bacterium]|nr:MGMT family protein [Bacteroidia bacterium]
MDKYTFFQNVFDVVRQIPDGKATSYGAIAKYLGSAKSSRMVGYAMNASHQVIPPIPAHRVVNRNGLLTGKHHFGGNTMQELLEAEGFIIENNQIQHFDKHFWDPNVELVL